MTAIARPAPSAVLELLKPITWFPPMWAFGCGVVSSGMPVAGRWPLIFAGALLAGPLVCATSQAVNDWYDRHVDAINEPGRPIPSGRVPGQWGLYIGLGWTRVVACGCQYSRPVRSGRGLRRPRSGVGLQRAADPVEEKRLVGQRSRRRLL